MNNKILFLFVVLALILASCNRPMPEKGADGATTLENPIELSNADSNGIVWLVEPILAYDIIFHCDDCGYTARSYEGNSESYILDDQSGQIIQEHGGHGGPYYRVWIYDAEKDLFGEYIFGWEEENLEIYPNNEFSSRFPSHVNNLNLVRQVDSSKIISENEDNMITYSLGEVYENSKYAVAYGNTLVSDFVFDISSNLTNDDLSSEIFSNIYYTSSNLSVNRIYKNAIAVRKDDKWGFLDKYGNTVVPFIFDHAVTADGNTAFVKYKGNYGILDLNK